MVALEWKQRYGGERLKVGDVEFRLVGILERPASTSALFNVRKSRPMIDTLQRIVEQLQPKRILELGICEGGSTALLAQLCQPEKLVAVEYEPDRVAALDAYIAQHRLEDRVRPYYGLDQSDPRLAAIVDGEFDEPLDLVVDDASHRLRETSASFDVLFPRLRPGGVYVIEDWNWAEQPYENGTPGGPALSRLVVDLVMCCAQGTVASVYVDQQIARIERC